MLTTALLAYLAAFICYFVQWTFGQPMIDQPLGVGLVAGIIFGDVSLIADVAEGIPVAPGIKRKLILSGMRHPHENAVWH